MAECRPRAINIAKILINIPKLKCSEGPPPQDFFLNIDEEFNFRMNVFLKKIKIIKNDKCKDNHYPLKTIIKFITYMRKVTITDA